jgi:hypothetical protein
MNFNHYEHIDNHYQIDFSKYENENWIATEKIHGTNYSFICDGIQVVPAKRNLILTLDCKFYDHASVFKIYEKIL